MSDGLSPMPANPPTLPFAYIDDAVNVQLRAASYPYGAGQLGIGVQLTLDNGRGEVIAVRLPVIQARDLALAMMAALRPWLPVPTEATP